MTKTVSQLKVKTAMSALIVREENLAEIEDSMKEMSKSLPEGELVELANVNSVSVFITIFSGLLKLLLVNFDQIRNLIILYNL